MHTEPKVLVCALESDSEWCVEEASGRVQRLGLLGLGTTSVVSVPRSKPLTRNQYDTVAALWPTHFHEDKMYEYLHVYTLMHVSLPYRLEETLRQEMFSPEELSKIRRFMQLTLEGSKDPDKQVCYSMLQTCIYVH